ncbi:MAG: ATP synthase F0 subunit B [Treponema sp.]|jgi:F-type H+-transporting ATPase subunit b|nr:ATP synthase F0 subunit B [Treponema sp.]
MLDFSVTFVITIINIVILFFILRAILFKPVTKFMAERAKRIQNTIEEAGRDKAKAQALLAQYENQLKNAETEAKTVIKAARENAEAEAEQIAARGREEAETLIASARRQIEAEQQAALARFNIEAAALVMAAAARLAARDFNSEDNRHYANMLLDELSVQRIAFRKGNS